MSTSAVRTNVERDTSDHVVREPRGSMEEQDRHDRNLSRAELLLGIAVPVGLLLLWEITSRIGLISEVLFPPPSALGPAGVDLFSDGRLLDSTLATLRVILVGFLLGSIAGISVGIACGTIRMVRAGLEPLLSALYVIPKLALLPIFLLIFGFGDAPKVALVSVTVFFYVWIQTMEAVASIPNGYLETARTFELSPTQMLVEIYVPSTLPLLFVGLRIAMSVSVLVTIAAEFVIGGGGMGYLIFNARTLMQVTTMYVGIFWVSVIGVTLTTFIVLIGRVATPWANSKSTRHSAT